MKHKVLIGRYNKQMLCFFFVLFFNIALECYIQLIKEAYPTLSTGRNTLLRYFLLPLIVFLKEEIMVLLLMYSIAHLTWGYCFSYCDNQQTHKIAA